MLLLHLKKDELFEITIPSKLGAYLKIGKPILCGVSGEAEDIVMRSKSGLCFEPHNYLDLVNKIMTLKNLDPIKLNTMASDGKKFYEKTLSIEIGLEKILDIIASMSQRSKL